MFQKVVPFQANDRLNAYCRFCRGRIWKNVEGKCLCCCRPNIWHWDNPLGWGVCPRCKSLNTWQIEGNSRDKDRVCNDCKVVWNSQDPEGSYSLFPANSNCI